MRSFVALLILGLAAGAAEKPNVLMIVADDWGWTDFGCMGHSEVRTPNLDRLAKEGTSFQTATRRLHFAVPAWRRS